ncbi:tRNA (guanine-N(7)-)-methyltransferase [Nitrosospira sp. Nsp5]|uniref:tRNA (guanine-N(7)-)-methyltransferase n=1 Tax=Nitrosospira multiformis TaxID=1231 RepID=A0ABY0TBN7_9PROT|nr:MULTISPECIES: tRNA (guanosine(46)-N7)-methyltransferase TrmB [Nitrosospira]PTR07125.1 tRNA (guanine-N(7)-)-methyltransferase [Nitrosospira sp. Nsp5]SDQ34037.1 tRNA (guanine-N(7)-)-methyltransferase [Nitrosospira multiformis]
MTEHRPIRSFVLRQGRVSNAQRRAHETLMPKYGIPFADGLLDLGQVFGRSAPKFLEIGFGMGETTATIAKAHPQYDYLAIDVHTPGVGSLLKQIDESGLVNVRVIQHDAVEVLQRMLPSDCLDGVHIFFPDPWPKARHHKRRLIQPEFITLLCRHLKQGAYIHAATDWEDYAGQILEVLSNESQLANTAIDHAPRPEYRPLTKFEQRGLQLGHGVWDLVFRRK